ncbi:uncharacterized protein LOC120303718 [Crotalus tigris]|uniref:uncharacterized protein LOC120303718 n=1 Tax=Crotalus tigris TaxID=88082 RepID=UPI00192F9BF7|nr:uncharacterized protein LOC120303718 [Crotalus tigris]
MLSRHHLQELIHHTETVEKKTRQETATRLSHKMNALRKLKYSNSYMGGLVCNLSSKILTHSQLTLLQRDIGHNLMDASALDFIAALEPAMYNIGGDEDTKSSIRQQVTGLLTSHRYHHVLSRDETQALRQLKRDDSIVILPADKGRMTVVMDKTLYTTKALKLLNDRTAYRIVEKDPSVTLRNKINKLLNNLKRSKKIRDDTLKKIRPRDTALARFYGLPKIHKEGTPLRPIVSFIGAPTSGLAKTMVVVVVVVEVKVVMVMVTMMTVVVVVVMVVVVVIEEYERDIAGNIGIYRNHGRDL